MRSWVALGMDLAAGAPLSTRDTAAEERPTCSATTLRLTGFGAAVFFEFGLTGEVCHKTGAMGAEGLAKKATCLPGFDGIRAGFSKFHWINNQTRKYLLKMELDSCSSVEYNSFLSGKRLPKGFMKPEANCPI